MQTRILDPNPHSRTIPLILKGTVSERLVLEGTLPESRAIEIEADRRKPITVKEPSNA